MPRRSRSSETKETIGLTAAKATINKYFTKEKIHRFIFGTREKQGAGKQLVIYGLLICIGFIYLYPLLSMVSTSFMNRDDLLDSSVKWLPSTLYLQNYAAAGKSMDFWISLLKGIVIAGLPTLCNVAICMMVGYGFATFNFKGKTIMMGVLLLSYILPSQVTMIPTYVLYNNLKIVGSPLAFVLPAILGNGLNAPIFILIFYQFFRQVPRVLLEAAKIDGAGHIESFIKVGIPSAGPAILTVFLFSFVWYWNESYLTEMYVRGLSNSGIWTNLVIQLKNFETNFNTMSSTSGDMGVNLSESVRMAAVSLSIIPLMLMYLVLQKHFVESIDRSGITGE